MLAKANQALATLDKYRSRLDQVSTRLTALEFEGGVTLHDVLTVLQRAELVTRMAVEIERYIVELGTEGRLIEMQLEETMVGVAADRPRSCTTTSSTPPTTSSPSVLDSLARLPHQDLLDFGRLAELLGYDRKAQHARLHPVSPRGHRILGRIPRLPKLRGAARSSASSGGLDEILAATDARAGDRRGRRRHTCEGHPRGPSPPTGDQPRGPLPANVEGGRISAFRSRPSTSSIEKTIGDLEFEPPPPAIYEIGDHVVYPHHGAGKVLKKETEGALRREARVPDDPDPPQRHDGDGAVRERRPGGAAPIIDEDARSRRCWRARRRRAPRCRRTGTGASSTTARRSRPATSTSSPRSSATSPSARPRRASPRARSRCSRGRRRSSRPS